VAGGAGNVSLRLDDRDLLATPRGVHKGHMRPADPVRLSLSDPDPRDVARATSELPFHLAAHGELRKRLVVLHTHAPALTALGIRHGDPSRPRPPDGGEEVDRLGLPPELGQAVGPLRGVPFHPSGSQELAEAVGRAVRAGGTVLVLERHGVVALGETLEEALDRTELAELGARAVLMGGPPG
jgi:L-fuculose-phosphate aldolase